MSLLKKLPKPDVPCYVRCLSREVEMARKKRLENPDGDLNDRLKIIVDALRAYAKRTDPLNKCDLLALMEYANIIVDERTVRRDLNFLREEYEAPIKYSKEYGFHLTDPSWEWIFEREEVSARDVYTLSLATALTAQFEGTPLHTDFNWLTKTVKARYELNRASLPDMTGKIAFLAPPAAPIAPAIWQAMMKGLREKRWLKIQYKPYGQEVMELRIAPCRLVSLENEWYLFSRKSGDLIVRQLAVRNILQAEVLTDRFTNDSSVAVKKALDHRFGWFACDRDIQQVTVVFDKAIRYLVDTRIWQKKQSKRTLENGDLEISFPTSAAGDEKFRFFEVRKWILAYGRYVKSVSPPKLKQYVLDDLKAAQSNLTE